jgi:hypothetical protein
VPGIALLCSLGHPIARADVLELRTLEYSEEARSMVYVKFVCSECRKLNERFIAVEDWPGYDLAGEAEQTSG